MYEFQTNFQYFALWLFRKVLILKCLILHKNPPIDHLCPSSQPWKASVLSPNSALAAHHQILLQWYGQRQFLKAGADLRKRIVARLGQYLVVRHRHRVVKRGTSVGPFSAAAGAARSTPAVFGGTASRIRVLLEVGRRRSGADEEGLSHVIRTCGQVIDRTVIVRSALNQKFEIYSVHKQLTLKNWCH